MENQLYSFNYGNYGSGAPINMSSTTKYFPRSVTEPYIASDTPLLGYSSYFSSTEPLSSSSMLFNRSDSYAAASNVIPPLSTVSTQPLQLSSHLSWPGPPGVDVGPGTASSATDFYAGLKRPGADAIYHPTITSTYNMIGQNEALFSTNPLYKRPRVESACNFPVYPLRPGEKNCIHYMLTRTCMYGDSCKFNHPIWVPEGGIPDWKEVPPVNAVESLPERPSEPDCPYFVKTQQCRYGSSCKFNHPKASATAVNLENADFAGLPERPSEPPCAFYMKTGTCRYGTTCKFHHPKDLQVLPAGQENNRLENTSLNGSETAGDLMITKPLITPALVHNSIGLPIRQGEVDCPFYLKTGSCKFSATCRYNHPEINTTYPTVTTIGTSTTQHVNLDTVPASSITQTFDPKITQTTVYPPVAAIGTSTAQHLNFGAVPASSITQTFDPKITQTTVYPPVAAIGTSTAQHLNFGAVPASSITPTFDPKITQTTVYPPVAAIGTSTAQHVNFGAVPASSITQTFDPKLTQTTVYPPVTSIGTSTAQHLNFGAVPTSSIMQTFDPRITQTALQFDTVPAIYPQRPGELECDFYMKTGDCKFGQRCRFHHPFDRSASSLVAVKDAQQQIVKLNLAGLPRREGSIHCPFYMKTGACKYGATCKFDHPSPGEVMTSTNSQATAEEQGKADETKAETDNK